VRCMVHRLCERVSNSADDPLPGSGARKEKDHDSD